jgi:hypothetical protein
MSCRVILVAVIALAPLAGCGGEPKPLQPIVLDANGVLPRVDYGDLDAVLGRAVDKDGRLDAFDANLVADRLDQQLKRLAVTGPTATPTLFASPEDRLAYWYNARAAWSIKLAMLADCPQDLPPASLEGRAVPLDGRSMTLDQIDAILAQDADWRVAVGAPSLRMNRPPLPAKSFTARDIRQQATARVAAYIGDDKRFNIDIEHRVVYVPWVMWQFRQRLIDQYNATYHTTGATQLTTALLPLFEGLPQRRLQGAVGFTIVQAAAGPLA